MLLESVCEIGERVTVILFGRDRLQEASGKEACIAESRCDALIDLILSAEVEFLPDVAAGRLGIGGKGYRAAACVERIMCRCEPKAFVTLAQLPLLADGLFYAGTYLLKVFSAELVRELEFVVIRRIELVKGVPVISTRSFGSRCVIRFDEDARSPRRAVKRSTKHPVSGPCVDRTRTERAGLTVHLDFVIERGRQGAREAHAGCG